MRCVVLTQDEIPTVVTRGRKENIFLLTRTH